MQFSIGDYTVLIENYTETLENLIKNTKMEAI